VHCVTCTTTPCATCEQSRLSANVCVECRCHLIPHLATLLQNRHPIAPRLRSRVVSCAGGSAMAAAAPLILLLLGWQHSCGTAPAAAAAADAAAAREGEHDLVCRLGREHGCQAAEAGIGLRKEGVYF
jgi:hypothetical protein